MLSIKGVRHESTDITNQITQGTLGFILKTPPKIFLSKRFVKLSKRREASSQEFLSQSQLLCVLTYFISSHPFCSSPSHTTCVCGDSDVAVQCASTPSASPGSFHFQLPYRNFGCFSVLQKYHNIWSCCLGM